MNTDTPVLTCPACGNADLDAILLCSRSVDTFPLVRAALTAQGSDVVYDEDAREGGDVEREWLECQRCRAEIPDPDGMRLMSQYDWDQETLND